MVWEKFRVSLPWFREIDRFLVEVATVIRTRVVAGDPVGITALNQLRLYLG